MGIEEAVRTATTREVGPRFVDGAGRPLASYPAGRSDSDGPAAELEILRGQLSRILHERTAEGAEYVFEDRITALDESDPSGVTVTFRRSPRRAVGLVVLAEGLDHGPARCSSPAPTRSGSSASASPT